MDRDNKERKIHDFMNVESLPQLPFIWSTPKEKGIKLFGIEFGSRNVVNVSSVEESELGDTIIACEDANKNNDDDNNNNCDESSRRFECHYCCRNFPTSQALGGHQNAHKRERQHAKRAQLQHGIGPFSHGAHVYGLMNYHRLAVAAAAPSTLPINNYPSWNTNSPSATASATTRFYGASYSPTTPINGSPLAMLRISATQNNVPSFGRRERSLLNPLPLFSGDEMRKGSSGTAVGGGGSAGSHQTRFVYDVKSADQVMQKHQKYFSIRNANGKLMPYFIAVANGEIDAKVVIKGNEAVLRARYEDAKFFYEADTSKRFSQFRNQLSGILFHEKLGSMLDKMARVESMVVKLSLAMGINQDMFQDIQEAASLAMSDLATAVVTEFTSLAGIMARHYALRDGFSEQIAEALFEITLPRFSGDILPQSDVGIVLSVANRLDSLVGLFSVGCQPTSTSDPFGLRRIAYGLVQILVEKDKNLDLERALRLAADSQPIKVDTVVIDNVNIFVTRRLEQFLVDKGLSSEIVRSVLAERSNFPCLAAQASHKMNDMSKGDLFPKIVEAYARPTRIISGKDVGFAIEVDEAAFESNEERALWNTFLSIKNQVHPGIEVDEFFEISTKLIDPLEDFFEHVFVMVDDEKIRKNRLALLKEIADLPRGIADLSLLSGF